MDTGYSIDHIAGIRERVKKELKPARYEHTLGVAYTAACMAFLYGEDPLKAELAGILHDCAKCYPHEEQIRICRGRQLKTAENILHWMMQLQTNAHSYSWVTELLTQQKRPILRCRKSLTDWAAQMYLSEP